MLGHDGEGPRAPDQDPNVPGLTASQGPGMVCYSDQGSQPWKCCGPTEGV